MRAAARSLLVVVAVWSSLAHAQPVQQASNTARNPITVADIKAWNSMRGATLSNDGKWFAYVQGPAEGDGTLYIKSTTDATKEMKFPVGGTGGGTFTISGDSKWIGFSVAPPTPPQGGRGGRGGAAPAGGRGAAPGGEAASTARNKLVLVNLASGEKKEFERIRSFSFNADAPNWIALQGYGAGAPAQAADAGGGGRGGFPGGGGSANVQPGDLNLYRIATGEVVNIGNVAEFAFDGDGHYLAYTTETPDMIGNGVQIRNLRTDVSKSFDSERALYRRLVWNDSIDALAVLRGVIDTVRRDTLFSILTLSSFETPSPKKFVFNPAEHSDFPKDMKIAVARAPRLSADMQTIFFGVRAANKPPASGRGMVASNQASVVQAGAPGAGGNVDPTPGGGRGAAPGANADMPSLVMWHSRDSRLQWAQIVQEQSDRNFNYLTQYRIPENKVIQLVTDDLRTVNLTSGDKAAYGIDTREYETAAVTTGRNYADVYQVDLKTGARKLVFKKQPTTNTLLRSSPNGLRALYWGTDGHWWVHDYATGAQKNITKGVTATSFVDVEDDHNNIFPPSYQALGWSKDNANVILSDGWDLWKVPVDGGAAVNLTGNGKKDQIRYRAIQTTWTLPAGRRTASMLNAGIDLTKPLYITMYGEWTKKEGVARVDAGKTGANVIFFEPAAFAVTKARDAETFVMTRQKFNEYPNYHLAGPDLKPARQLTDANPQMANIAWSSGAKLIDYVSDKGDKLQAAMYLPANYDPTKKYPMLVTIYEKRSQGLNRFVSPSETRAPDPSIYTSNGYIVLDPDIVYKINDPGMSAVWCVIPAVKAAIATGSVDEKKVGLWGHSWGGYQTSFLVTQTDIFSAAIAGAPLTNMVSMYGSVYWNSGNTDAGIFESSQGRFKGSFIENHEAYIRNSPVFFADKVKTPLIILHNDKDGAVDFNQGITYFTTLVNQKKDVILLEYMGENHGLARPANQRDYAGRMREYFDHHLTGKAAPDWIKNGVPRLKMDEHLLERKAAADSVARRIIVP
jgi:dipeptidyl aminopeptidase/acylaminoacyl peptidase